MGPSFRQCYNVCSITCPSNAARFLKRNAMQRPSGSNESYLQAVRCIVLGVITGVPHGKMHRICRIDGVLVEARTQMPPLVRPFRPAREGDGLEGPGRTRFLHRFRHVYAFFEGNKNLFTICNATAANSALTAFVSADISHCKEIEI